jgi:hypothetical protein
MVEATLEQFRGLIDTDPRRAIAEARKLETGTDLECIKAAIFIDAGIGTSSFWRASQTKMCQQMTSKSFSRYDRHIIL